MCDFRKLTWKLSTVFYLPALQQGSGGHQVMSGKDEATSGQSHRSAGVSLEKPVKEVLLNAGF